jgi:hypothetical protein
MIAPRECRNSRSLARPARRPRRPLAFSSPNASSVRHEARRHRSPHERARGLCPRGRFSMKTRSTGRSAGQAPLATSPSAGSSPTRLGPRRVRARRDKLPRAQASAPWEAQLRARLGRHWRLTRHRRRRGFGERCGVESVLVDVRLDDPVATERRARELREHVPRRTWIPGCGLEVGGVKRVWARQRRRSSANRGRRLLSLARTIRLPPGVNRCSAVVRRQNSTGTGGILPLA